MDYVLAAFPVIMILCSGRNSMWGNRFMLHHFLRSQRHLSQHQDPGASIPIAFLVQKQIEIMILFIHFCPSPGKEATHCE